jgi:hypothetical protein
MSDDFKLRPKPYDPEVDPMDPEHWGAKRRRRALLKTLLKWAIIISLLVGLGLFLEQKFVKHSTFPLDTEDLPARVTNKPVDIDIEPPKLPQVAQSTDEARLVPLSIHLDLLALAQVQEWFADLDVASLKLDQSESSLKVVEKVVTMVRGLTPNPKLRDAHSFLIAFAQHQQSALVSHFNYLETGGEEYKEHVNLEFNNAARAETSYIESLIKFFEENNYIYDISIAPDGIRSVEWDYESEEQ